jgi:Holliday junction resolvase RusA-like endonuclease
MVSSPPARSPFFDYVVFGRPASTQPSPRTSGGQPKKNSRLPRWREVIKVAIIRAWEEYSKDVYLGFLRLDFVWIYDRSAKDDPDLDNIIKPFIDQLEGLLYDSDRMFREMHMFKFELQEHRLVESENEKLNQAFGLNLEFVYVRITPIMADTIRVLRLTE